ncbi:hypothetical protein C4565_02510 [Candidatus Parcubacteria bacterium]|jgi:predicted NUDIX family phosphoesterase|nr:MAG: hypothetical protein C4565_02510 [Candidatus Parcubacteria bacterium]
MKCLALPETILEKHPIWMEVKKKLKINNKIYYPLTVDEQIDFINFVEENKSFFDRFGEQGIEENDSFQQIIFYCVIRRGNQFFVYQRGGTEAGSKETRLAMKISVGVGGHIEPFDTKITDALYRELDEELVFKKDGSPILFKKTDGMIDNDIFNTITDVHVIGIVKEETGGIGMVHTGLVTIVDLRDVSIDISIRENEGNIFGQFMDKDEYDKFITSGTAVPEIWTEILKNNNIF